MPVLGTAPTDPNFYSRKAAQGAETLQMIVAAVKAKEEKKRQLEMSEIDRFFKMAQDMPEVADTWGRDLALRYGKKYPGVEPMVQVYQQRSQLAGQVKKAGESWAEHQKQIEAGYAARLKAAEELPDTIDIPGPTGPVAAPNPAKVAMQESLAQTNPATFGLMALHQLDPIDRKRAGIWAKSMGSTIPSEPDLFGDDLPVEQRAGLLAQMNWLLGESAENARVGVGQMMSKADKAKQDYSVEERKARERHDTAERTAREQATKDQTELTDRLTRERQGIEARDQKSVAAYRAGLRVDDDDDGDSPKRSSITWKAIQEDANVATKDYDARMKDAAQEAGGMAYTPAAKLKAKAEARKKFVEENGPRPVPIPETQARIITKKVATAAKKAGLSETDAALAVEGLLTQYRDLVAKGMSPAKATAEIFKD